MKFKMDRVHVWGCQVADEPGGVAAQLSKLAEAGVNLDYVSTRRSCNSDTGELLVGPLSGRQAEAAREAGFEEVFDPVVMRITGDNTAGLASKVKLAWARAGINVHGSMIGTLGSKFLGYVTFDSVADGNRAMSILGDIGMEQPALAAV